MVKKQTKRISSKIIKMDKNNQYGMAMTKSLPYGYIKKRDRPPTLAEFNKISDEISHDDPTGHLFIVDIKFDNVNPKTLLFNELHPPIFEKTKRMKPYERSTLPLLSIMVRKEGKDKINFFLYNNSKTHSRLKEKK